MPLKKSIRMKTKQPRTAVNKRARAPWWTDRPAIAAVATCVTVVMVLIAAYESSEPAEVKKADATTSQAPARTAGAHAVDVAAVESSPEGTSVPVTLTGCLERSDQTFRLKDTTGANAPKARSWKSGFLKKGSAPIDVVEATKGLNLSNHVGQRVSVTGTLVDREMHVRSLRSVTASCSTTPRVRI